MTVPFDPERSVRSLVHVMLSLELLAVLLDVWLHCSGFVPSDDLAQLFDSTREGTLGSWLAVTQTGAVALTLWGVVVLHRHGGHPRGRVIGWTVLAVCFTYLAVDDGAQVHERLGTAFEESKLSGVGLGAAFPSYYWQLVVGPVFAAMGLFLLVFLWREVRTTGLRFLVVVALGLLGLAVAMDFTEGLHASHPLNIWAGIVRAWDLEAPLSAAYGQPALVTVEHFARSVEESIEMAAMTTLWAVVLLHTARTFREVRLTTEPASLASAKPTPGFGPSRVLSQHVRRLGPQPDPVVQPNVHAVPADMPRVEP